MSGAELLTVAEMAEADRLTVAGGVASLIPMENAGRAVADEADRLAKGSAPEGVAVLCGPGNNGGDGYVAARHLKSRGWKVWVETYRDPKELRGDAARMFARWDGETRPLTRERKASLIIDALFGAGLDRPLGADLREAVAAVNAARAPVLAVDVPSGLSGDTGRPLGEVCVQATRTVTFFRKKPGHLLFPGRALCGETVVADIGIPTEVLEAIRPNTAENLPALWSAAYPWPDRQGHKYDRGHVVVVSGPAHATGAARLAARGALRIGAGLVSVASPLDAVAVNAAHLTAIMIKPFEGAAGLASLLGDRRFNAVVLGPGLGVNASTKDLVEAVLEKHVRVVLDADALTAFAGDPEELFQRTRRQSVVLTPHEGEFERLFPSLMQQSASRLEAARAAAKTAGCVILLKGPDTVIARSDGRAAINANAPPWLATAGAGDVLAGFIGGLLAQAKPNIGMSPFDAACAAVWLHGEAAARFGIGLIAEDLPETLPQVLNELRAKC